MLSNNTRHRHKVRKKFKTKKILSVGFVFDDQSCRKFDEQEKHRLGCIIFYGIQIGEHPHEIKEKTLPGRLELPT